MNWTIAKHYVALDDCHRLWILVTQKGQRYKERWLEEKRKYGVPDYHSWFQTMDHIAAVDLAMS